MATARRIRPEERDEALACIVASFHEDPVVRWWFPDEENYAAHAGAFFGVLLDCRMAGGEVWVTDECRAVAMWNPPGGNLIGPEVAGSRYLEAVAELPDVSRSRIEEADRWVDQQLPMEPHWYLGVLVCHPAHRRRGLARAVLSPVLEAADRAGVPVALDTATAENVTYYSRYGFAVFAEAWVGCGTGPRLRLMLRSPAQAC